MRIATFNCENLFARFKFAANIDPAHISEDGLTINDLDFGFFDRDKRRITAKAIEALRADVVALQEVENLRVLERFRNEFLGGAKAYPHLMLVEGNDPRFINVALMSRYPIVHARSYRHLKSTSRSELFSRDCLETDIQLDQGTITLYINHFKSMAGGREATRLRRLNQVSAVQSLIEDRFGSEPGRMPFVILGDFNDYIEVGDEGASALTGLLQWDQVENVVGRLQPEERWTHFYQGGKEYRQLDYILVSETLKGKVRSVEIERRGMPLRAERYQGERFSGVGWDNPKASDHCPVVVEMEI
jgi:endonuclease/exonuclease/phosphatase family metal-dependent hydrolase